MQPVVIVLPGYLDSGPEHWQTLWCNAHPEYVRIQGLDWLHPHADDWIGALDAAVRDRKQSTVIVAHSLGVLTTAMWGQIARPGVVGALLVTPPDSEAPIFPDEIVGYQPMPRGRLAFPSTLVASHNDPWMSFDRAADFARAWGSTLVDAGMVGHLNVDSGFGPWNAGELLLAGVREGA